jgi:hypothetical protein
MFVPHRKHIWATTVCYGDSFTLLYVDDIRTSQETPMGFRVCYGDSFTLLYIDDIRTSQDTHIWATTVCYGNSFTLLYIDDIRTSQNTHIWATTVCYGDSFTLLYIDDVRTSQETHMGHHGLLRGRFPLLYVEDRIHTNGLPQPELGIALLCYM